MNRFSVPKASSQDVPRGGRGASSACAAAGMRAQVSSKPGPKAVQPPTEVSVPGRAPQGTHQPLCPVPRMSFPWLTAYPFPTPISFLTSSVNRISFFLRHCAQGLSPWEQAFLFLLVPECPFVFPQDLQEGLFCSHLGI